MSEQAPAQPQASRPTMPEYGLLPADQGRGLLPWQWAQTRLEESHNYWVTSTRPDGRPHATVVWGVWWENRFYFSTGGGSRKARNLAQNPACVICTENAHEAVIVEGIAYLVRVPDTLRSLAERYQVKYRSGYPDDSTTYSVRPQVIFGFIEADFVGSATRWRFVEE